MSSGSGLDALDTKERDAIEKNLFHACRFPRENVIEDILARPYGKELVSRAVLHTSDGSLTPIEVAAGKFVGAGVVALLAPHTPVDALVRALDIVIQGDHGRNTEKAMLASLKEAIYAKSPEPNRPKFELLPLDQYPDSGVPR